MVTVEDYRKIVGDDVVALLHRKARPLYGRNILNINSTFLGGGVAEMLSSLIPLMNKLGLEVGWRILHGNPDFFDITKKFHNGLQSGKIHMTTIKKSLYERTNENFSVYTHIDHDCVVIHDPQPLPLIKYYNKRQPWIWRCHVDFSQPNTDLWDYLKNFVLKYDQVLVSHDHYKKADLPIDQKVIYPAIDPFTQKNVELSEKKIARFLKKFNVPTDKPIITQISRFDPWKDPEGVVKVFKEVRKEVDCRLVLCGSMAADDPEGWKIYNRVKKQSNNLLEKGEIIFITSENGILVNALQRASKVIIQKSLREGFGLTVTEAMWKETPVVASNVGGIPLQITSGENGYLVEPEDINGFADTIIQLLKSPEKAQHIGEAARESVGEKFLITRLLADYLDTFNEMMI